MTPEEKAVLDLCIQEQARLKDLYGYEPLDDAIGALLDSRACHCPRDQRVYCHADDCHGGADIQEWVSATFLMCLAGDRIRIGQQETDVRRSSSGVWHANNANAWHPTPWEHTELRMDLAANPGFQEYPPNTPCEILMSPERKAAHLLMQSFPGSQIIS